jgi:hypothetical protein
MCTALGEQEQIRNGQSKGQILQVEVSIPGAGRP